MWLLDAPDHHFPVTVSKYTFRMRRLSLTFALLTLSPALAQEKVSFQPVPLPYVTLSAPGYAVRAEVRPAVTYPESGPNVGPYFQFSPSQIRVVLDRAGQMEVSVSRRHAARLRHGHARAELADAVQGAKQSEGE